jgi:hypothetical protein
MSASLEKRAKKTVLPSAETPTGINVDASPEDVTRLDSPVAVFPGSNDIRFPLVALGRIISPI